MRTQYLSILALLVAMSCNNKMQQTATKEFVHGTATYSKSVVVNDGHVKTIYIAGLTGDGADLEAQTRSAWSNIKTELDAAGATFKDIVKTNIYIVNCTPDKVTLFRSIRKEYLGDRDMPASTLLGVPTLAATHKLVEIEAVAVIQTAKAK